MLRITLRVRGKRYAFPCEFAGANSGILNGREGSE